MVPFGKGEKKWEEPQNQSILTASHPADPRVYSRDTTYKEQEGMRILHSGSTMRRSLVAFALVAGASAFSPALAPLKLWSSSRAKCSSLKMVYGTPRSLSPCPPFLLSFALSLSLARARARALSLCISSQASSLKPIRLPSPSH